MRLVVVGGGFSGAVLIINAIRATAHRLDIEVVEPAEELGRGIAYGTRDPAHRINVPTDRMGLFQEDPTQATRWLHERGTLPDPASDGGDGRVYVARQAYGSFVGDVLRRHAGYAMADAVFVRIYLTALDGDFAASTVSTCGLPRVLGRRPPAGADLRRCNGARLRRADRSGSGCPPPLNPTRQAGWPRSLASRPPPVLVALRPAQ